MCDPIEFLSPHGVHYAKQPVHKQVLSFISTYKKAATIACCIAHMMRLLDLMILKLKMQKTA